MKAIETISDFDAPENGNNTTCNGNIHHDYSRHGSLEKGTYALMQATFLLDWLPCFGGLSIAISI